VLSLTDSTNDTTVPGVPAPVVAVSVAVRPPSFELTSLDLDGVVAGSGDDAAMSVAVALAAAD
jgi:hypothetical protein